MIAALEDDDPQLRRAALVALQRIGPQTRTIPALLEAMRAGDLEVRGPAAASIQNFAKARLQSWQPVLFQSDAPVLRNWLGRYHALYGIDASPNERDSRRRAFDTADFFEILGGRAAIRESVQLHLIDDPLTPPDRRREYPVESLESVRVDSHPFEKKMLKESRLPPAELPLANIVPPDHFFAYFSSLRAFRETFDGGSDLFVRLESTLSAKSIEYDQKAAYLSRLGLSESILNELEAGGAIRGIGFVAPDLFFVDGTEITVIAELASADLVRAVLQVTGIGREANEEIAAYELELGKTVFWATRGDLLLLSTHREELQSILSLADAKLESLGRSDEFQYMLQRLPIEQDTQAYFYFSDPFIRRLVGPRTKIAQLRRMQARAEMEMLVAGALLYRLDGHHSLPTKQRLIELGYVPAYFEDRNYTVRDDLTVHSDRFGSIAELKSLRQVPIGRVSERELNAYKEFVDHYSRYWRQFFRSDRHAVEQEWGSRI